jgi:epimerase transport system membrane fusion protein
VHAVLVRDGDQVKAGQPVLVLGDVGVDADRNRLDYRVSVETAALARLEAEQNFSPVLVFPPQLVAAGNADERVRQALVKEAALFHTRRQSLLSEVALMKMQRDRVEQEMIALRAQIEQAQNSLELQKRQLKSNQGLAESGFIAPTRLDQIEGGVLDYAARLEQSRSELARAAQKLVDSDLRIKTSQNQYAQAASDQLKATAARLGEIEQEQRKSADAAARQVVTAPVTGEVIDLKFTSAGAVIRPGEPIADIVPSQARLMVEAHIRPEDINNVFLDQNARIKFTAFKYRNTTMIAGKVTYVSGDRLIDRATNIPYYGVLIAADAESLKAASELKVQAGMPAEVYIEGTKQTPLQYMAEPITSVIRRAGRQL